MVVEGHLSPLFIKEKNKPRQLYVLGFRLPEDAVLPEVFEQGGTAVLKYTRDGSFTVVPTAQ